MGFLFFMSSTAMSPNHREALVAQSSITGQVEYVYSTSHALNVNISGSSITGDINLAKVGGVAIALGQTTMAASLPVTIANNQSALSVSAAQSGAWTVTANAGTNLNTSALALDATLTNKNQFTKLTDGTDTALITAAGEQNVIATAQPGIDIGDVTVNNTSGAGAVNIQDGGNSITVDYATTGSGTATGALRVELPTNGTGVVGLNAGTNVIGALTANQSVNLSQIAGTTTATGNGVAGTGVQRVTIASDNTAFSTNATLSAETTKVIGTVRTADGSGNLLTSTTGSLNVNITGGSSSGTQYAELTTTAPGTGTLSLARYKASPPVLTDGQMYGLQLDTSGNLKVTGSLSVGGTTDNSAYTAGTSQGTPAMGFYHSTIDTVTDGRAATIGITSKRAMFVNLQTAAGAEVGTSGAPLRIDPTGGTTQPVSLASTTITGNVTVTQATGTNLHAVVDSGSITANAGTNLNTSLLALESGGNLASIKTDVDNLNLAIGSTTSGQKGNLAFGATTTAAPTYTTAQSNPLSLTTTGALRIDGSGSTQPISGTITANAGTGNFTVVQATGSNLHTVLDSGTLTTLTTLTGTTTLTPGGGATNLGKVEDAGHTTGDTGVFSLAVRNDNAATSTTNANADYSQMSVDITGTQFVRSAPSNTPALTNVAASVTSVTVLAANAARRTCVFYNDSTSDCYIKWGTTASSTSFTTYAPSLSTTTFGGDDYAGIVTAIWISATGNMRVTESTI